MSFFEKPSAVKQVERRILELVGRDLELVDDEAFAQHPLVEHELDVEGAFQARMDLGQRFGVEALGLQGRAGLIAGACASEPWPTA